MTAIQEQSPDIARGVDDALEHRAEHSGDPLDHLGAGDQGMMFGFACRETEELMPLPIAMAHRLSRRLADVRKAGVVPYLRPDGKSQVSIEYEDGRPVRVDTVLISRAASRGGRRRDAAQARHRGRGDRPGAAGVPRPRRLGSARAGEPDRPVRDRRAEGRHRSHRAQDHRRHLRRLRAARRRAPSAARIRRRSTVPAAYMARLRREEHRGGGPRRPCAAPGRLRDRHRAPGEPAARDLRHRAGRSRASCASALWDVFDFRPAAIIRDLDLARPIYRETAAYGHFGRKEFPWEGTDRADDLRAAVG